MNTFGVSSSSALPSLAEQTAPRRVMQHKLNQIGEDLKKGICGEDQLSILVREWHQRFQALLRSPDANFNEIEQESMRMLKKILADPITGASLDRDSLLGSDGYTYAKSTLQKYWDSTSEPYHSRSPLNSENPALFTTRPHPLLEVALQWFHQEQTQPIPKARLFFSRPIRMVSETSILSDIQQQALRRVQEAQASFVAKLQESRELNQRGAAINREALEVLKINTEEMRCYLMQKMNTLEQEIELLERDNKKLQEEIETTKQCALSVQHSAAELKLAIQQTELALKKSKKSVMSGLIQCVAIVGVCLFINWAAPLVIESVGVTASTQGSGMMLSFTVAG